MYLNFHTHQTQENANCKRIYNLILPQDEEGLATFLPTIPTGNLSVGIHPWHINKEKPQEQLNILRELARQSPIKMIGECGLDRNSITPLKIQEEIFVQQIRIAEEVKKPLVLHIVRCFSELLSIQKLIRPKIPMIVHGFNNKPEIAQQLVKKGFYFSFGAAILQENSNAQQVIKQVDLNNVFLENDDKNVDIDLIYEQTARILKISVNDLQNQIWENWIKL
jgi:TatD DNase family protein